MHNSRRHIYDRIANAFSQCSSQMPYHYRQSLWESDDPRSECSILGRTLPEAFEVFLEKSPILVPSGWNFFGITQADECSIKFQNAKLFEQGMLPDGWLCFANFVDDDYFFFRDLGFERKDDVPVVRVDSHDLADAVSSAELVASGFGAFILDRTAIFARELELNAASIVAECQSLGEVMKNNLGKLP